MRLASIGLLGRLLIILLLVMGTEFVANTILFQRTNQFALRDEDARRMAEHLVVARRVLDGTSVADRPNIARELSTTSFTIKWSRSGGINSGHYGLIGLRNQIVHLEPELLPANLRFNLQPLRFGGDLAGSLELRDNSHVSFHTFHTGAVWSLTFGRILTWIAPTLVLIVLGVLLIRVTLRPLRVLMKATHQVGTDAPVVLPEQGPTEMRTLIHSFNVMQHRIHRLIASRTQALAAVGHDLRTPLARLQLRLDTTSVDPDAHRAMSQEISEMTDLLHSLQVYLSAEGATLPVERIDLAAMASTIVDSARDADLDAFYLGPSRLEIWGRAVSLRRSLANLVDNALHHGGNARLSIQEEGEAIVIMIDDDGPGIDEEQLASVVQPFVRLDNARSRNTRGMGLGLAIVKDAIRAEGGIFSLANRAEGGLRATIRLPAARA